MKRQDIVFIAICLIIFSILGILSTINANNKAETIICYYIYDKKPELTRQNIEKLNDHCANWIFISILCTLENLCLGIILMFYLIDKDDTSDVIEVERNEYD